MPFIFKQNCGGKERGRREEGGGGCVDEVTVCALTCPNVKLKVNVFSPLSVFTGWRKKSTFFLSKAFLLNQF